jgi:hypothetical protein
MTRLTVRKLESAWLDNQKISYGSIRIKVNSWEGFKVWDVYDNQIFIDTMIDKDLIKYINKLIKFDLKYGMKVEVFIG